MESTGYVTLLSIFSWLLLSTRSYASSLDIECLKSLKESLKDPAGHLAGWNFQNLTEGFICNYNGVECWHPYENKVLNLDLSNFGLGGEFPSGLENCTGLAGLDLSRNYLTGSLPADISKKMPYLTAIDLSLNSFTGDIPINLSGCRFLNTINLQQNNLSGTIPWQLTLLNRLTSIDVSNNQLSGSIPAFNFPTTAPSFTNNLGLCGTPLEACNGPSNTDKTGLIIGSCVATAIVAILIIGAVVCFILHKLKVKKKEKEGSEDQWVKVLKGSKGTKVSMFEKSVYKMKLEDLMAATNVFNKKNIIGIERTGIVYKATLPDGSHFAVKRLEVSPHSKHEFIDLIETLGRVRHDNLVALLGFCIAKKERLLVYKHVPNGNLYDSLHPPDAGRNSLDWLLRLKISIGVADGLAYLHCRSHPQIWHRKISSRCILLEHNYVPRISDFGLDRLMNPADNRFRTFTNQFGDHGYVAPEYARTLRFTPEADVYSFGVVLLELITGERPTHVSAAPERLKGSLVKWIAHLSDSSRLHDAVDESLIGKGHDSEILKVLNIACLCVLSAPEGRPDMDQVYKFLKAIEERRHISADDDALAQRTSAEGDHDELIVVIRRCLSRIFVNL